MRNTWLVGLWSLSTLLLVGCGASFTIPIRSGLADAEAASIEARRALGPLSMRRADPDAERARLFQILELEQALQNDEAAAETAHRLVALLRAEFGWARAFAADASGALRSARRQQARLVAFADEHDLPSVAVQAAMLEPERHERFSSVLTRHGATRYAAPRDLHDEVRAHLPAERLGLVAPDEGEVSDEELIRAGAAAAEQLGAAHERAARAGDLPRVQALATAFADLDAGDLRALLPQLYEADVAAGRAEHDDWVRLELAGVAAAAQTRPRLRAVARAFRLHSAQPRAPSLRLALALAVVGGQLAGDAVTTATPLLNHEDRDISELSQLVVALARQRIGDPEPMLAWLDDARLARSARLLTLAAQPVPVSLSMHSADQLVPIDAEVSRRAAARALVDADPGPDLATADIIAGVGADTEAPRALRRRAIDLVAQRSAPVAHILATCLADELDTATCEKRLDWVHAFLEGPDSWDAATLNGLAEIGARVPVPPPGFQAVVHGDQEELAALDAWLASYVGTRLSATEPWTRARLLLALRLGDADEVSRRLADEGRLLPVEDRPAVQLWLADLRAGRDVGEAAQWAMWEHGASLTRHSGRGLTPREARPSDEPATSLLERYRRAVAGLGEGRFGQVAQLSHVLEPLEGLASAEVNLLMGLAAVASDNAVGVARARERLERVADPLYLARLDAASEQQSGDLVAATQHLLSVLRVVGTSGFLERELADSAHGDLGRYVRFFTGELWREVAESGGPTAPEHVALLHHGAPRDQLNLPAELMTLPSLSRRLMYLAMRRAVDAEGRERARLLALAHRMAEVVGGAAGRLPLDRAWLAVYAGHLDEARRLLASSSSAWSDFNTRHLEVAIAARPHLSDAEALWLLGLRFPSSRSTTPPGSLAAFLGRPPAVAGLVCAHRLEGDVAAALPACQSFFGAGTTPASAHYYAQALGAVATVARERGVDPIAVLEGARRELGHETPASVHLALRDLLAAAGDRNDDAARAATDALAAGRRLRASRQDDLEARHRGLLVRAQTIALGGLVGNRGLLARQCFSDGAFAAARIYVDAGVAALGPEATPEQAQAIGIASDMLTLAEADLAAGRIDRAALVEFDPLRLGGFQAPEVEQFHRRHPESSYVRLGYFLYLLQNQRPQRAMDAVVALEQRHPGLPLLVRTARPVLALLGRGELGDAMLARARERYPDDQRVAEAPEQAAVEPAELPRSLASAEALIARLARVEEEHLLAGDERVVVAANGAEFMTYPGATPVPLGARFERLTVSATSDPRHSGCEGEQCLDQLVPAFEQAGAQLRWSGPATLPGGAGAVALLERDTQFFLVALVPHGTRLLALQFIGELSTLISHMDAMRLAWDTFRPLDAAVGVQVAHAAREHVHAPAPGRRQALAAVATSEAEACPLAGQLAALGEPATKLALLVDMYLAEARVGRRAAVLSCAEGFAAGALGMLAATDLDPRSHARARALVAADPAGALALARLLVRLPPERAEAGVDHRGTAMPDFGVVQRALVLPEAPRRALLEELVVDEDARLRTLGLLASSVHYGALSTETLSERIVNASANDALLATSAVVTARDAETLTAMRRRLDALPSPMSMVERRLASGLAWNIGRRLDRRDAERLRALAERVRARAPAAELDRAEGYAERSEAIAAAHRHGTGLERATDEDVVEEGHAWRAEARRYARPQTSLATARRLATEPLWRFLAGDQWTYVRVPQPSLFLAALRSTHRRLEGSSVADTTLARSAFSQMAEAAGGELFSAAGGLDLTRPVECAAAEGFPSAWVCSAYVADANAVRRVLAGRRIGTNSAFALPLTSARQAVGLPAAGGMFPAIAHFMMAPGDADDEGDDHADDGSGRLVARERARTIVDLDGVELERYATFTATEGWSPMVDTEHYLFTGDRVLAFGLEETARVVLDRAPRAGRSFERHRRVRALTRDWSNGGAVQLVSLTGGGGDAILPFETDEVAMEVAAGGDGLLTRLVGHVETEMEDVSWLEAMLPEGAVSTFSAARTTEPDPTSEVDDSMLAAIEGQGAAPPLWAAAHTNGLAFGWYTEPGEPLWHRWVVAAGADAELERAFEHHGWPYPAVGARSEHEGVTLARVSDVLVLGTAGPKLEATVAAASRARARSRARNGVAARGHLDGARAAAIAFGVAARLPEGDPGRQGVQILGTLTSIGRELAFEASLDRRGRLSFRSALTPRLAPPGRELELVDELLRNPRNALSLPSALPAADFQHALRYVFETDEPEVVARRVIRASPRVQTEVLGPNRLAVVVAPGRRGPPGPVALDEARRRRLLASDSRFRANAPQVRRIVAGLVREGAEPHEIVDAVLAEVSRRVSYQLTAESLDALTILERGRGDCTEFSQLAVTFLRAAGVPAELREGMAASGAEVVAHAWVAYHDGVGFREIDPTAGAPIVSSGHIPANVGMMVPLVAVDGLRVISVERVAPTDASE